jgi:hypothetical protein
MIETLTDNDEMAIAELGEIPINNVDGTTLAKVVKWIEHWKNTEQPTPEEIKEKTADSIDRFDEEFLDMELNELYDLVS